jgi:hypothetical protein
MFATFGEPIGSFACVLACLACSGLHALLACFGLGPPSLNSATCRNERAGNDACMQAVCARACPCECKRASMHVALIHAHMKAVHTHTHARASTMHMNAQIIYACTRARKLDASSSGAAHTAHCFSLASSPHARQHLSHTARDRKCVTCIMHLPVQIRIPCRPECEDSRRKAH